MTKKQTTKQEKLQRNAILYDLYINKNMSCQQISEVANFDLSIRQMQRILKRMGVIRTQADSFRLAVKQGRVKYHTIPEHLKQKRKHISSKLRYYILNRDGFACAKCGATVKDCRRLEIDHIDENATNNDPINLQTLCDQCNLGKTHQQTRGRDN